MTAHFLTHDTYRIQSGDRVLVHAAAGGVGALVTQVARQLGAYVIGTTSTKEKAQLAYEAGANEVIIYTQADFEAEVMRLTNGEGVNAVYDGIGKTTFEKSLNCLRYCGYMVLYGQSSGLVPPLEPRILANKSLFLTRPMLPHYIREREVLLARARDVFSWVMAKKLQLRIWKTYPLAEAAQAHSDLESGTTMGKLLLLPNINTNR
jgi:NADPH2:quinone reductase